jgi:superfamily II DNA or RNA helicase
MKGDRMIAFRNFQEQLVQVALRKARNNVGIFEEEQDRFIVADVHPGSGKTLAVLAAADRLIGEGFVDNLVVYVPRLNLAEQFEEDWNRNFRGSLPWQTSMKNIYHRENEGPLFMNDADGYITTYSSLMADLSLHLSTLKGRRFALVVDEAQQLGIDWYDNAATKSATAVERIAALATIVFVLSGTPYRSDQARIWGGKYSEPDIQNRTYLEPDVRAGYREGVRDNYLRSFEFRLSEGQAIWAQFGADPAQLSILEASQAGKSIAKVLRHPGFWQPLVDQCIDSLLYQRKVTNASFCMLVAAERQEHAREIQKYITKKHGDLRALLAISEDGKEAKKTLKDFRDGRGDILVTVNMAYVGYDHKPISHIVVLTGYRTEGYLRQLIARGLRVWDALSPDLQTCYAFVPEDHDMVEFVNSLREESRAAAEEREKLTRESPGDTARQDSFDEVLDAWMSHVRAMGLDPTGDLSPEVLEKAEKIRRDIGLVSPPTELVRFAHAWQEQGSETATATITPDKETPYYTLTQRMKAAKSMLRDEAARCDRILNVKPGTTYEHLFHRLGSVKSATSLNEIEERVKVVRRWKGQGRYD